MAIHLIDNSDKGVVYFGPRSNPRQTRYWAERGVIHMEDTDNGEFETISVREFLQRMQAISDMIANTVAKDRLMHADEIKRNQDFLAAAEILCRRAQIQGLPPKLGGRLRQEYVGSTTIVPQVLGNKYLFD